MKTLLDRLQSEFLKQFGRAPTEIFQAPGRVNLIGEHTDYNGGFVLPMTIDRHTVLALAPNDDRVVRVVALDFESQKDTFSLQESLLPHADYKWANYVRGTLHHLGPYRFSGADVMITGNVPLGAGLSSSASLEMVVAAAFTKDVPPLKRALAGQAAERDFAGCNCGIMDQLIIAQGKRNSALCIDCGELSWQEVPLPEDWAVVVIDSQVSRGLVESEYNTRRVQCEQAAKKLGADSLRQVELSSLLARWKELDPIVAKRARHVLTENQRTVDAAEALRQSDLTKLGRLMKASHGSMRHDFEITVPPIDILVGICERVITGDGGARMTGGGFGGCVVAVLPKDRVNALEQAVQNQYFPATGLKPRLFVCAAKDGAGLVDFAPRH